MWLHDSVIELPYWNFDNNSSLRVITFEDENIIRTENGIHICNYNGQIETLSLINVRNGSSGVNTGKNKEYAELLNLHNSVKNLTMDLWFFRNDNNAWKEGVKIISDLLTKMQLFNLANVNILLTFGDDSKPFIDLIFDTLKQNFKLLKHQFGQLNIGLKHAQEYDDEEEEEEGEHWGAIQHCDIIEWNANIDETFLDEKRKELDEKNQSKTVQDMNVAKFLELKQQWVSL